ncbi:MAG: protein kinase family protein [Legionellales bacterium]|nr:protein kinase family protein [Legionellales bacterium]
MLSNLPEDILKRIKESPTSQPYSLIKFEQANKSYTLFCVQNDDDSSKPRNYYITKENTILNRGSCGSVSPIYSVNAATGEISNDESLVIKTSAISTRESRAIAKLEIANLTKLGHDYYLHALGDNNYAYIIMPRAPGKDIFEIATDENLTLTWSQRLEGILGFLLRLQELHQGHKRTPAILHGDLKPENVMFDPETLITTVIDFAGASVRKPNEANEIPNAAYFLLSTKEYRNPSAEFLTEEEDIYSASFIVEMLAFNHTNITEANINHCGQIHYEASASRQVFRQRNRDALRKLSAVKSAQLESGNAIPRVVQSNPQNTQDERREAQSKANAEQESAIAKERETITQELYEEFSKQQLLAILNLVKQMRNRDSTKRISLEDAIHNITNILRDYIQFVECPEQTKIIDTIKSTALELINTLNGNKNSIRQFLTQTIKLSEQIIEDMGLIGFTNMLIEERLSLLLEKFITHLNTKKTEDLISLINNHDDFVNEFHNFKKNKTNNIKFIYSDKENEEIIAQAEKLINDQLVSKFKEEYKNQCKNKWVPTFFRSTFAKKYVFSDRKDIQFSEIQKYSESNTHTKRSTDVFKSIKGKKITLTQ